MGRCCAASRLVTGIILAMGPLRFRHGRGHANRAGNSALGSRVDKRHYSNRSQFGTTRDRLPKGLLHRPGSHLTNKDVGPDEQAIMRADLARRSPPSARHETCRSFSAWEGSWLDHKRYAQRKTRNRTRICETGFQQCRHQTGRVHDRRFCSETFRHNSVRSGSFAVSLSRRDFSRRSVSLNLESKRAALLIAHTNKRGSIGHFAFVICQRSFTLAE